MSVLVSYISIYVDVLELSLRKLRTLADKDSVFITFPISLECCIGTGQVQLSGCTWIN